MGDTTADGISYTKLLLYNNRNRLPFPPQCSHIKQSVPRKASGAGKLGVVLAAARERWEDLGIGGAIRCLHRRGRPDRAA
jgi:hypothetical protein